MAEMMKKKIDLVGVVGAGTMGIGVSADLLLKGMSVVLTDIDTRQLEKAGEEISEIVRFSPMITKTAPVISSEEAMEKIKFSTSLEDLSSCEFIVENVTENLALKEGIYKRLNEICPPEVCFGVNTSCISITQLAGLTGRREKFIGIHFMNPVFLKKTVEVIRGYHTSEETIGTLNQLLFQMGKDAVIVNDYAGFVSNRISHLFMNEAAFVFMDGVAGAEQIDAIFKKCYGHTMGPLETADLIGLDTVAHSIDELFNYYKDPKFRCCPLLKKMVHAGLLGRKSGRGFYNYQ